MTKLIRTDEGYLLWAGETIKEQQAQVTDLVAALEKVEWVGAVTNDYCPWCMGWRSEGHTYNCPRQQALANCREGLDAA